MKVYLDTADTTRIRELTELGVVDGVTTNPSLVADAGIGYHEAVTAIAERIDGPVFAQVIAGDADGMVREGLQYQQWGSEVVVKIPATRAGFVALRRLRAEGVPAGITVVFSVEQAVLAAKNDASFVAPYVGRLDDADDDGVGTVTRIQEIVDRYDFETEVLAASIRSTREAVALYEAGVDALTMSPSVLEAHVQHPGTADGVAGFEAAWGDRGSPIEE